MTSPPRGAILSTRPASMQRSGTRPPGDSRRLPGHGPAWYVCGSGPDFCTVHRDDGRVYRPSVPDHVPLSSTVSVDLAPRPTVAVPHRRPSSTARPRRLVRGLSDDVHVILALALVAPVLVAETLIGDARLRELAVVSAVFIAVQ